MKINKRKLVLSKIKLLNLQLIKIKAYKNLNFNKSINDFKYETIEYRFKKALHLIFNYYMYQKKFLFVGIPPNWDYKLKFLLKKTDHKFISKFALENNIFTGITQIKKDSKYFFNLKNTFDLVILYDESFSENRILKEIYSAKIPVITLNSNLNIFEANFDYKIPTSLEYGKISLFLSTLISLFKKTKYLREQNLFKKTKVYNLKKS